MRDLPFAPESKIAIVGAGPAGIHMSYELKKRGFKNVVIYEKSARVGGKTYSQIRDGVNHELGTTGFAMAKESPLERLIFDVFPNPDKYTYKIDNMALSKNALIKRTKRGRVLGQIFKTLKVLYYRQKFSRIHCDLVKKGYPFNMDKDDKDTLNLLSISMKSFLLSQNLDLIYRSLKSRFTAYGYGKMESIPAFYGLMLMKENYLSKTNYRIFKKGNDFLWRETIAKFDLDVELGATISGIDYSKYEQNKKVSLKIEKNGNEKWEAFDFAILTTPYTLSQFLPCSVSSVFKDAHSIKYIASLVEMGKRDNSESFYTGEFPAASIDSYDHDVVLAANFGKIREASTDGNKSDSKIFVCFQLNDQKESQLKQNEVTQKLENQIKTLFDRKAGLNQVFKSHTWENYCPSFPMKSIESGVIQHIEAEQGKHGLWYTGSCMSGELVSLVLDYNDHLLNRLSEYHCAKNTH